MEEKSSWKKNHMSPIFPKEVKSKYLKPPSGVKVRHHSGSAGNTLPNAHRKANPIQRDVHAIRFENRTWKTCPPGLGFFQFSLQAAFFQMNLLLEGIRHFEYQFIRNYERDSRKPCLVLAEIQQIWNTNAKKRELRCIVACCMEAKRFSSDPKSFR